MLNSQMNLQRSQKLALGSRSDQLQYFPRKREEGSGVHVLAEKCFPLLYRIPTISITVP